MKPFSKHVIASPAKSGKRYVPARRSAPSKHPASESYGTQAWQSHGKNEIDFVSLAMTVSLIGIWMMFLDCNRLFSII
jgi:hypothetical protein